MLIINNHNILLQYISYKLSKIGLIILCDSYEVY